MTDDTRKALDRALDGNCALAMVGLRMEALHDGATVLKERPDGVIELRAVVTALNGGPLGRERAFLIDSFLDSAAGPIAHVPAPGVDPTAVLGKQA